MKKTFKLLSFVLLLAIFIQSFSFSAFAFSVSEDLLDEYKLLESIGIYNNTNINENAQYITRAQFVVSVFNLLRLNKDSFTPVDEFADVKSDHFAHKEITAFKNLDYIAGVGDNKFNPDANITMQQGVKILVAALGSKPAAEGRGGHPRGYVEVAKSLKIWDSTYGLDDDMTCDNFVKLIYDTLRTSPLTITGIEGDYIIYETDKDETIFSKYYDIYGTTGIVTEVNLKGVASDAEPTVVIGGEVFKIGDVDVSAYLGLTVNAFYKRPDKSNEKTVVFIYPEDNATTLKITDEDIVDFNNMTYYYVSNDKEKTAKIKATTDVYYNGAKVGYFKELMIPKNGTVTLVKYADSEGSGYDAVMIEDSTFAVVSGSILNDNNLLFNNYISYYQIENDKLVTKNANSIKASENDEFYYNVFDDKGAVSSAAALQDKMVVTVFMNPYNKGVKLIYSQQSISGKITAISSDNNTVTINDTEYGVKYGKTVKDENNKDLRLGIILPEDIKLGLSATFMLDSEGDIVSFKREGNGYSKAFLVRAYVDGEKRSENVKVVLYDVESKSVMEREMADKVKFNGTANKEYKGETGAADLQNIGRRTFKTSATSGDYVSYELIQYKVDSENKITEFHTVDTTELPDFRRINTCDAGYGELIVRHQMYTVGDKVLYNDSTLFANLPRAKKAIEDYVDYAEYYVVSRTKYLLSSDQKINATCDIYYFDDDPYADFFVRYGIDLINPTKGEAYPEYKMEGGTFTEHGIVTKISKAVTASGETTDKVSFINLKDGSEEEYVVSPKYASDIDEDFTLKEADLSVGDVFIYHVKDELMGNFVKAYDYNRIIDIYDDENKNVIATREATHLESFLGAPLSWLKLYGDFSKYEAKDANDPTGATSGKYTASYRMTVGYVYSMKDGVISIAPGDEIDDSNLSVFKMDGIPFIICDSTSGKVNIKLGSAADVKDAASYGTDASKILVYIKSGKIVSFVIYND